MLLRHLAIPFYHTGRSVASSGTPFRDTSSDGPLFREDEESTPPSSPYSAALHRLSAGKRSASPEFSANKRRRLSLTSRRRAVAGLPNLQPLPTAAASQPLPSNNAASQPLPSNTSGAPAAVGTAQMHFVRRQLEHMNQIACQSGLLAERRRLRLKLNRTTISSLRNNLRDVTKSSETYRLKYSSEALKLANANLQMQQQAADMEKLRTEIAILRPRAQRMECERDEWKRKYFAVVKQPDDADVQITDEKLAPPKKPAPLSKQRKPFVIKQEPVEKTPKEQGAELPNSVNAPAAVESVVQEPSLDVAQEQKPIIFNAEIITSTTSIADTPMQPSSPSPCATVNTEDIKVSTPVQSPIAHTSEEAGQLQSPSRSAAELLKPNVDFASPGHNVDASLRLPLVGVSPTKADKDTINTRVKENMIVGASDVTDLDLAQLSIGTNEEASVTDSGIAQDLETSSISNTVDGQDSAPVADFPSMAAGSTDDNLFSEAMSKPRTTSFLLPNDDPDEILTVTTTEANMLTVASDNQDNVSAPSPHSSQRNFIQPASFTLDNVFNDPPPVTRVTGTVLDSSPLPHGAEQSLPGVQVTHSIDSEGRYIVPAGMKLIPHLDMSKGQLIAKDGKLVYMVKATLNAVPMRSHVESTITTGPGQVVASPDEGNSQPDLAEAPLPLQESLPDRGRDTHRRRSATGNTEMSPSKKHFYKSRHSSGGTPESTSKNMAQMGRHSSDRFPRSPVRSMGHTRRYSPSMSPASRRASYIKSQRYSDDEEEEADMSSPSYYKMNTSYENPERHMLLKQKMKGSKHEKQFSRTSGLSSGKEHSQFHSPPAEDFPTRQKKRSRSADIEEDESDKKVQKTSHSVATESDGSHVQRSTFSQTQGKKRSISLENQDDEHRGIHKKRSIPVASETDTIPRRSSRRHHSNISKDKVNIETPTLTLKGLNEMSSQLQSIQRQVDQHQKQVAVKNSLRQPPKTLKDSDEESSSSEESDQYESNEEDGDNEEEEGEASGGDDDNLLDEMGEIGEDNDAPLDEGLLDDGNDADYGDHESQNDEERETDEYDETVSQVGVDDLADERDVKSQDSSDADVTLPLKERIKKKNLIDPNVSLLQSQLPDNGQHIGVSGMQEDEALNLSAGAQIRKPAAGSKNPASHPSQSSAVVQVHGGPASKDQPQNDPNATRDNKQRIARCRMGPPPPNNSTIVSASESDLITPHAEEEEDEVDKTAGKGNAKPTVPGKRKPGKPKGNTSATKGKGKDVTISDEAKVTRHVYAVNFRVGDIKRLTGADAEVPLMNFEEVVVPPQSMDSSSNKHRNIPSGAKNSSGKGGKKVNKEGEAKETPKISPISTRTRHRQAKKDQSDDGKQKDKPSQNAGTRLEIIVLINVCNGQYFAETVNI